MDRVSHPGGFGITKRAFEICGLSRTAKILDVGCGYGDTTAYLSQNYGFDVTGVDNSAEAVSIASQKHPDSRFIVGDGQRLDFESRSFDCVLMECTLSLFDDLEGAIREAYRVLKKEGYLIVHDLYLPARSAGASDLGISIYRHCEAAGTLCQSSQNTINSEMVPGELGFEVILFEDRKKDLTDYVIPLIFSGEYSGHINRKTQGAPAVSYFLMVAVKKHDHGFYAD